MKKVEINIREETYKAMSLFRDCLAKMGHPATIDETAEMACKALLNAFMATMDEGLPPSEA